MHRFYEPPESSMDSVGIEPLTDERDELEQAKAILRKATVELHTYTCDILLPKDVRILKFTGY
jgi:hypothetical protein